MRQSIKNRVSRLEAMHRPPGVTWTIPVDICEWDGVSSRLGRVVAHIPARPIEYGQPFDYDACLAELLDAYEEADDALPD